MYVVSCRHSRRFRRDRPRLCHSIKAKDGGHDASRYHRQRNGIHRSGRQPSSGLLLPSKISIVFKRIIRQSFALFSLSFVSATFDADMGENFVCLLSAIEFTYEEFVTNRGTHPRLYWTISFETAYVVTKATPTYSKYEI